MSHLGVGSFKKRTREWYGKIGGRPSPIVHRLYLITYDVQKKYYEYFTFDRIQKVNYILCIEETLTSSGNFVP